MKYILIILLSVLVPCAVLGQVEICDNGIDDDNDGLIDLNDEDCECEVIQPISLISNPSFEELNCCPDNWSQLDCAVDWIQASVPTTDFIHHCDWLGWDDFPPPQPFPDGQGIMGFRNGKITNGTPELNWKEYAGACLISPLLKDSSYRFQFDVGFVNPARSPTIDITFFGTTSCNYLPFGIGTPDFGCPTNHAKWEKLGEVTLSGGIRGWKNTFIEIVPTEDIYAIAIGPDCAPSSNPISTYYFFDNLLLADLSSFDLQISEVSHPCRSDFALSVPNNSDFQYQWYLSGIALQGEVFSTLLQNYGEGDYQVRILDDGSCRVSEIYTYEIPSYSSLAQITICEGDFYEFGTSTLTEAGFFVDTFQTQYNCDSIVFLELSVTSAAYDTLEASILEGEIFEFNEQKYRDEGEYPLVFTSYLGCDSLVNLKLSHFNVFIPNAFSPNGDGINDVFHPFAPVGEIQSFEIKIFDRWGNFLYQGATEWNGSNLAPGVYVYLINIEFTYGATKMFSGDVTLVK